MTYRVKKEADANGYSVFFVYKDEKYVAGPWPKDWQASRFIETLTEGRYMAKADRTAVMRGRRGNGKLVLRDQREDHPPLLSSQCFGRKYPETRDTEGL